MTSLNTKVLDLNEKKVVKDFDLEFEDSSKAIIHVDRIIDALVKLEKVKRLYDNAFGGAIFDPSKNQVIIFDIR